MTRDPQSSTAERDSEAWFRSFPWLAALVGCTSLIVLGFPMGHDWLFELVRVSQYGAALASGQLPPYWGEDLYAGYGSPVFLFYAPLFSAVASVIARPLGSNASGAVFATVFFSLLAVPFMLRAARALLSEPVSGDAVIPAAGMLRIEAAARVSTYVWVLHPYLLGNKLVRNASAEFAALCLLPLVLYGVLLARRRPMASFLWTSAGLALVVMAHNLTGLVAMSLALCATALHHRSKIRLRVGFVCVVSIGFGLGLAFWFWYPALELSSLVRIDEIVTGKFDFRRNFPDRGSLFGYSRFFSTGLVTPVVVAAAFLLLAHRHFVSSDPRSGNRGTAAGDAAVGGVVTSALLLLLLAPVSAPIWQLVPGLALFQFPWRLAGPLAFVTSLLAGWLFLEFSEDRSASVRRGAELAVLILCVANALPMLRSYRPLDEPVAARLSSILAPDSIRNGTQSVTVGDEYLPRDADPAAWRRERPTVGPVVSATGGARLATRSDTGSAMEIEVVSEEQARLRIARWYFPGWRAAVDGVPHELSGNESGSIDVLVPAGAHRLELWLGPPRVRKLALAASLGVFVIWLGVWIRAPRWLQPGVPEATPASDR